MKYAIVSDIHANRQAWNAVLLDIRSQDVDEIICLGDVVGYGPSPAETLQSVYANVEHLVLGNHDAVLAGRMGADAFNDSARLIIDWSRSQLDGRAPKFFASLPLVLKGEGFAAAHAEFCAPGRYRYILDPDDTVLGWDVCDEQVLFVGHTHVPRLFVRGRSGTPHLLAPCDFQLEPEKRYIVNVGSVGQPRDGDPRAGYVLFDTANGDLLFRRIPFDVDAYRADLERTGLPLQGSYFLAVSERQARPCVRDVLDFRPPAQQDAQLAANVPTVVLESVVKSARRWRRISVAAAMVALAALAAGGALSLAARPGTRLYGGTDMEPLELPDIGAALLHMPSDHGQVDAQNPLAGWIVQVDAPRRQSVTAELLREEGDDDPVPVFRIHSAKDARVRLLSRPVSAAAGTRFTARGQFKCIHLDSGYVEVAIVERMDSGAERLISHRQPRRLDAVDRWVPTSVTMPRGLPGASTLQYVVQGEFSGEILLRKLEFFRRE